MKPSYEELLQIEKEVEELEKGLELKREKLTPENLKQIENNIGEMKAMLLLEFSKFGNKHMIDKTLEVLESL